LLRPLSHARDVLGHRGVKLRLENDAQGENLLVAELRQVLTAAEQPLGLARDLKRFALAAFG
jgi:hypothetical protein